MKRIDQDTYELSTGRRISANFGILGLFSDANGALSTRLTEGLDGSIEEGRSEQGDPDYFDDTPILTPAERREIAEHQIGLWAEWAGLIPPDGIRETLRARGLWLDVDLKVVDLCDYHSTKPGTEDARIETCCTPKCAWHSQDDGDVDPSSEKGTPG